MNGPENVPHSEYSARGLLDYAYTFPTNISARRDHLAQYDGADCIEVIDTIHDSIRKEFPDSPRNRTTARYEYDAGCMDNAAVPDMRDSELLLRRGWNAAVSFLQDSEIQDQRALQLAGITIANTLLLVHPAADGNGRISRVISYIMASETWEYTDMDQIVSKHLGNRCWLVQPQFTQKTIRRQLPHDIRFATTNWQFGPDNHLPWAMSYAPNAVKSGLVAIIAESENPIIQSVIKDSIDERLILDSKKVISELSVNENDAVTINGLSLLFNAYRQARAEVIEMYLHDTIDPSSREGGVDFRQRQLWALYSLSSVLHKTKRPH